MKTFGIAVPVLNQQGYIDQTLTSFLLQGSNVGIRLHVQDGGSTDGTLQRLDRWTDIFSQFPNISYTFSSEKDDGVPQALNRAFGQLDADFYSWIGADDVFMPFAFYNVVSAQEAIPGFEWVTGVPAQLDESSHFLSLSGSHGIYRPPSGFSQQRVARGLPTGFFWPTIQQEGTFWSNLAFDRIGRTINEEYRVAFDFDLWAQLAQVFPLLQISAPLAAFRKRPGQLSGEHPDVYRQEMRAIRAHVSKDAGESKCRSRRSRRFHVAHFDSRARKWVARHHLFPIFSGFRLRKRLVAETQKLFTST